MSNSDLQLAQPEENQNSAGKITARDKNKRGKRVAVIFAIVESVSLVLWAKSEDFLPPSSYYIRWCGYCGLLAGAAFVAHKLVGGKFKRKIICCIWTCWILLCLVLFLTKSLEPKPHFIISLQIGDSFAPKLLLTNDFLFQRKMEVTGALPGGSVSFKAFVPGCLVVPVKPWETNKVFIFTVENDSEVKVNDLEMCVGFPENWKTGFDPKWRKMGMELYIPKMWKFSATNMQYVGAQSANVLFPYDTLDFPSITNPCVPEYIGSTFKCGLVEVSLRSSDLFELIAANILFAPADSDFSKPYVTFGNFSSNGLMKLNTSQEEFKKSQK